MVDQPKPMTLKRLRFTPAKADQIRVRYEDNISNAIREATIRYAEGAEVPPPPAREYNDTALASFMHEDVFQKANARAKAEKRRLPDVIADLLLAEEE